MADHDNGTSREIEGGLATHDKTEVPRMFRVLMHNDHYTTMEFVVDTLISVFRKNEGEAYQIMMSVHTKGVGICGTYTFDIARTKIAEVHKRAREKGYPLRCSYEEA